MFLLTSLLHLTLFLSLVSAKTCKKEGTQQPIGGAVMHDKPAVNASSGNTVGTPLKASFTAYGSADKFSSTNCKTEDGACGGAVGKPAPPGYIVAVSQNLYQGPAVGAQGKACYHCYQLELNGKTITVIVNNLCPADAQNTWCTMGSMTAQNEKGGNVNFDLCDDTGAAQALFGHNIASGQDITGLGTATLLDKCPDGTGGPNFMPPA